MVDPERIVGVEVCGFVCRASGCDTMFTERTEALLCCEIYDSCGQTSLDSLWTCIEVRKHKGLHKAQTFRHEWE